ncbi:hypothetical protein J2W49_001892 [Hydrogenophaga palleronii]|uniref:Uncharacterized protein n=1 Tax=Hydrogenophaga palleronii TaxID=65655 RepID=A0ABU1WKW2_9BURK|nr:hypothetical protein [Hydrogenophaga palleronii]MDR7149937.1 hypothetical protein [Hydrogenophaga palleronii]
MSATFSRIETEPTAYVPPLPPPEGQTDTPGKLGTYLRDGGALDSGIHRQMAGKQLLENADQYADNPVEWEEAPKGKELEFWDKSSGVVDKPKDPRLKKDKDGDGGVKNDSTTKSSTLGELFEAEDRKNQQTTESSGNKSKPYDRDKYYDKNPGHLDGGRATDWLNQKSYETKLREKEAEKAAAGDTPSKSAGAKGDDKSLFTDPSIKRTGLSADTHYGNYTPELREGPLSDHEIRRDAWHAGHEKVNRLNGGAGYSQTNAGVWTLEEKKKNAGTGSVGVGARAEIANNIDVAGSGELTLRANGMAGFEGSGGGKFKVGAAQTTLNAGAEARVGAAGEFGGTYRPVTFEPKILGAPINLSPEINWAGRGFNGAEVGAGFKSGWRMVPDPMSGKMSPEAGIEAKAAAFVGGKAEGEATVGLGGVGNVGGSVAGLYGLGAEGKAKVGLTKDESGKTKLKFELKGALALGLGLGLGVKGEINIDGLMRFADNLVKANQAFLNKVGHGAQTAINTVKQGVSTAVADVKQVANKAFDTVKDVANTVVDKVKEAATKTLKEGVSTAAVEAKQVANKAVDTVKKVTNKAVDTVKDVANTAVDKVKEVAAPVVEEIKDVAEKVGDGIKEGAKKVGGFFKGLFK